MRFPKHNTIGSGWEETFLHPSCLAMQRALNVIFWLFTAIDGVFPDGKLFQSSLTLRALWRQQTTLSEMKRWKLSSQKELWELCLLAQWKRTDVIELKSVDVDVNWKVLLSTESILLDKCKWKANRIINVKRRQMSFMKLHLWCFAGKAFKRFSELFGTCVGVSCSVKEELYVEKLIVRRGILSCSSFFNFKTCLVELEQLLKFSAPAVMLEHCSLTLQRSRMKHLTRFNYGKIPEHFII